MRTYTRGLLLVVSTVTPFLQDGPEFYVLVVPIQDLSPLPRFDLSTIVFIQFIRPNALHVLMLEPVRHRLIYAF